jgi:outer membrane protein TolC
MTPTEEPDLPHTAPELRAERLGFALRGLAAELVDERRKVAQLRQQVASLQAQLDVAEADRASNPKPTID